MKKWYQAPLYNLNFSQRIILRLFSFLFGRFIILENEAAMPPAEQPAIFAFNHNCSYETVLIVLFLIYQRQGKRVSFLVDWMYGHLPILGWLVRQSDPVFVYNKPARIRSLDRIRHQQAKRAYLECCRRLEQGDSIGIFPEGTRNRDPNVLRKGKKGIGKIALATGVPVVPIGVDFPARRSSRKIPHFGPLILRIGKKMTFPGEIAASHEIKRAAVFSPRKKVAIENNLAATITHKIMLSLAKLSGKAYPVKSPRPLSETRFHLNELLDRGAAEWQ